MMCFLYYSYGCVFYCAQVAFYVKLSLIKPLIGIYLMPNTNVVCHYSFQPYSAPVLKIISGIELIDIRVFRNPSNALSTNGKYGENRKKNNRT